MQRVSIPLVQEEDKNEEEEEEEQKEKEEEEKGTTLEMSSSETEDWENKNKNCFFACTHCFKISEFLLLYVDHLSLTVGSRWLARIAKTIRCFQMV